MMYTLWCTATNNDYDVPDDDYGACILHIFYTLLDDENCADLLNLHDDDDTYYACYNDDANPMHTIMMMQTLWWWFTLDDDAYLIDDDDSLADLW